MLEHNFASSYYAVLIDSNKLNKQDKKQVLEQLKAKSWIMNYTYKGKQKVCKYLIYVFGIDITSLILSYREKIKKRSIYNGRNYG